MKTGIAFGWNNRKGRIPTILSYFLLIILNHLSAQKPQIFAFKRRKKFYSVFYKSDKFTSEICFYQSVSAGLLGSERNFALHAAQVEDPIALKRIRKIFTCRHNLLQISKYNKVDLYDLSLKQYCLPKFEISFIFTCSERTQTILFSKSSAVFVWKQLVKFGRTIG